MLEDFISFSNDNENVLTDIADYQIIIELKKSKF